MTKIYQTLKLEHRRLISYSFVGNKVLDIYNKMLNKYGLNLNTKLTDEQLSIL